MANPDFVEYGRAGARKRWDNEVVRLQELDPETRSAVRAILKLDAKQKARRADAA